MAAMLKHKFQHQNERLNPWELMYNLSSQARRGWRNCWIWPPVEYPALRLQTGALCDWSQAPLSVLSHSRVDVGIPTPQHRSAWLHFLLSDIYQLIRLHQVINASAVGDFTHACNLYTKWLWQSWLATYSLICGRMITFHDFLKSLLKLSHPAIVGPISASVITRTLFSPMFPPTTLYQGCCAKVSHGLKESMGYHSVMLQGLLRLRHQSWGRGATWAPGFQPA